MSTKSDVFIDNYQIDDSRVYLSFRLGAPVRISDNLELSFSLILENDEIKDSSVSFSGVFQLMYTSEGRNTNITLRPNTSHYPGEMSYNTDMLTYTHSMSVEKVYDKISNLPLYIEKYVSQVAKYAKAIIDIKNPNEVKSFIVEAVNKAKKDEFSKYKEAVLRRLAAIESNSIFDLFVYSGVNVPSVAF